MPEQKECCDICKHSLYDNDHGFDQNDGYIDETGKLVTYGTCTYCKDCRIVPKFLSYFDKALG